MSRSTSQGNSRFKKQAWFTGGALVICLSVLTPQILAHEGHDHEDQDYEHGTSQVEDQMVPANRKAPSKSQVRITIKDGFRYITSNGIPSTKVGAFPNRGNPHRMKVQAYQFKVPVKPQAAQKTRGRQKPLMFGVSLDGVPFDPGTAEAWRNDRRSGWNVDALSGHMNLGLDENRAHVQPGGQYHFHGIPQLLVKELKQKAGANKMIQVGWAADGYPIYANYAYKDPKNPESGLIKMTSSYVLKKGTRPGGNQGPGGRYDGTYVQDYQFIKGVGDLDEHNGRFGVTPEFPQGTYYYMLTEQYPFIPRSFKGQPDPSFQKAPPQGRRQASPQRRRF